MTSFSDRQFVTVYQQPICMGDLVAWPVITGKYSTKRAILRVGRIVKMAIGRTGIPFISIESEHPDHQGLDYRLTYWTNNLSKVFHVAERQ